MATAEDATPIMRERLLTWFAEMACGRPKTMDALPRGGAGGDGSGVIILPAVMIPKDEDEIPEPYIGSGCAGYTEI